jgi:hypothetical protein
MKIELDYLEVRLCEYIGELRSSIARKSNVIDAKMGKQNGIDADIQGFKAEYAFAKLYNLFPDFGLGARSGSYDGKTRYGTRYDIKSTNRKDGNLLSTLKVNNDVDVYILAYVNENIVEFIGWIDKSSFIREENIKDMGHGKTYFLNRNELNLFS